MQIVRNSISVDTLKKMAEKMHGGFVKAVIDIEKNLMMVDLEMHADGEAVLLDQGSQQEHLWGIRIYPAKIDKDDSWIEFTSMINFRPLHGNMTRWIEDKSIQEKIVAIVQRLIKRAPTRT